MQTRPLGPQVELTVGQGPREGRAELGATPLRGRAMTMMMVMRMMVKDDAVDDGADVDDATKLMRAVRLMRKCALVHVFEKSSILK